MTECLFEVLKSCVFISIADIIISITIFDTEKTSAFLD